MLYDQVDKFLCNCHVTGFNMELDKKWMSFHGMRKAHLVINNRLSSVCGVRKPWFGWIEDNEKKKCILCLAHEKKWGKNDKNEFIELE